MKENEFLLSIIIPTRNRQEYAEKCILQILEATSEKVQIVIQDNSDEDSLAKFVEKWNGSNRIKYNYTSENLSFVANFSQAVALANGYYVCMIGDDDGINPEIEKFVEWAIDNGLEAVNPSIKLNYIWPDSKIAYYKKDNGNLTIVDFTSTMQYYDTKSELLKLLNSGCQNYLQYKLVKIYHGIVKKEALDKVKAITGHYFGGLSPDIYSSVALSFVIDKVLMVDYPLTIPGVCFKSGSGQSSTGRHDGKLSEAPHFKGHESYVWSTKVPSFYSVETIWADSALAALHEMREKEFSKRFNVFSITAYCFVKNRRFKKEIFENLNNYCQENNINKLVASYKLVLEFLKGPLLELFHRIIDKLTRKKDSVVRLDTISDISVANAKFQDYLNRTNKSFHSLLANYSQK